MGYTAGTLDLSILGASDSAIAFIDKTVKALNSLSRAITKINSTQFVMAGQQLEILFSKIAKATNSINVTNITNLASAAKSLSAISKIGNLQNVDFTKVASGFGTLTIAISPFIAKVKEAESSLTALYGILNKSSGKKINSLLGGSGASTSSGGGLSGSFSRLFKIGSWTAILYSAKRLGSYVGQIVQHGADYTETLNLWQTAMGGNLNIATEFVNKMNEAYGISEKTLMNAQAIFKNMLGSLGQISDTMAYSLSEGITQMALDYASLYNVTFEQAFTKFQAALAGQVRPIRSVSGYDITENTLFQLYQSLGGTKTMRQLSRTEKQLLAIYAVFNQMEASGAVGDLQKTMESFANQSRVMAEAWQKVLTYSGTLVTHLIEQTGLITYLNAVLIFLGDTLKEIAESIGAIKTFADPFESTTEGALDTSKAIDEVNGKLLGFDKFRSLSGSNENNALGIDNTVLDALSKYKTILETAKIEARAMAEGWKELYGLTFNTSENTWEWGKGLNEIVDLFNAIKEYIKPIWQFVLEIVLLISPMVSKILVALKPILSPLSKIFNDVLYLIMNIMLALTPIIGIIVDLLIYTLPSILEILHAISWVLTFALSNGLQTILWLLTPILVAFEAILKVVQSIGAIIQSLFSWNWSSLGKTLSSIWGSWNTDNIVNANLQFSKYSTGGLPDKGTMFVAGEAGAEIVYNTSSGQSGVANVQQIAQATYSGTMRALNDWWGGSQARGDIPQLKEANATGMYQAVTRVAKSQGKVWAKV